MSLTSQQQKAAYSSSSVVVIAGAGTGKTHLLTKRFLFYLQNRHISPLEIVTVTFTEKAAQELRSRIRELIKQHLPNDFAVLAELEASQISTIHALASRICQENSEAAQIPANFQVLDDLQQKIWLQESINLALANLPAHYFDNIDYSVMKESLTNLLNDPDTAQQALQQKIPDWQELIVLYQQSVLNSLIDDHNWQKSRNILLDNCGDSADKLEIVRQEVLEAIDKLQHQYDSDSIDAIAGIKVNCGSGKNWQDIGIVKDALKTIRDLTRKLTKDGLTDLEPTEADTKLQQILPNLRAAYHDVADYLTQLKHQDRILTFNDLETYAIKALANPQVRQNYQQKWRVFLIDEFQDTNPTQAKLLKALISNAEITIVGDRKQSIYGFRRADIKVFADFKTDILQNNGQEVVLSTSFRTHQPLIAQINRIFQPLLQQEHQDLTAFRESAPLNDGLDIPYIQAFAIASVKGTEKQQRQQAEAEQIALKIKQLLDSKTLVHDKPSQTLRPIEPKDILILTRTWSPLEIYGEAIAAQDIPIAPAGGGNLLATRGAKDGWTLLRFLADTQDDIALVALLRSPLFTISDRILMQTAQGCLKPNSSWWEAIQDNTEADFIYPIKVLSELLAQKDLMPPSRLLQKCDRLTGYTAIISNLPAGKRRLDDWQGFCEFIQDLETDTLDLFAVVRHLKQLYDYEAQIPRPVLETENAVRLMTIYAAKGLESSVVIVADLNKRKPSSYTEIYFNSQWGVALKTKDENNNSQKPLLYRWLEQQKKQQESAEDLRVLYVAFTRARDYLILSASQESGGDLDLIQPGLAAAEIPVEIIPWQQETISLAAPAPITQSDLSKTEALDDRQPALLIESVGSGIFELPVTALTNYARCPYWFKFQYVWGHPGIGEGIAHATEVGSLVHTALEHNITDLARLQPFCHLSWEQTPVTEALDLVKDFLDSDTYKTFRDTATAKEYPVRLKIEGIDFSGIVDLLGQDWLLDYKSDRVVNPQHHRFQIWAYASALGYNKAYIAYLRHNYVHNFTLADLDAIAIEAQQLVKEIVAGNYQAKPKIENCTICPYNSLCQFAILE